MFKSALYPSVVEFNIVQEDPALSSDAEGTTLASSIANYFAGQTTQSDIYTVIFKSGDDLRQDQLVLQMFSVMDKLLKKVNLDLKLTPFRVLATSTNQGMLEFVGGSETVSSVLSKHDNSILAYFQENSPSSDPSADYGIAPECMDTYVKSTAGYCVLTYILGVGDRHLENLMLKPSGELFHLDFGFIFGRDPKPYPPPFKLTREMVEGMGGTESAHYHRFTVYCCQAFNWLRKSANLILNLLNLMVDAGIEDLSGDSAAILAKVQEKFRLDLADEQAEHFFLHLINESQTAIMPRLMEVIHKGAVQFR